MAKEIWRTVVLAGTMQKKVLYLIGTRSVAGGVFPAVVHEVHESREGGLSIALVDQWPLSFDDSLVYLLDRGQALIWKLTSQKLEDEHSI